MWAWLTWLLAITAPAPPVDDAPAGLCPQLERLSEAANRDGSFARLVEDGFRPTLLETCRVSYEGGAPIYMCHQTLAPESATPGRFGPVIQACLPGTTLEPANEPGRPGAMIARHGRLSIEMRSRCDERCKAGRIAGMTIRVAPPAS